MDMTPAGYTEARYRVYNRCKYDIGVTVADGRQYNIRPGSFALMTAADIEYVDSICRTKKFFGSGMLVAVDGTNKEIPLDKLNIVEVDESEKHLTDEEITAALKKSAKAMEAWLNAIDDPVELHAIYTVASEMDLPTSKLKILNAKMPDKDWLDQFN